jgi:hypothetical protein
MRYFKTGRRRLGLGTLISAVVAAALISGAGTGHAASSFEPFELKSLIGTDVNGVSEVSFGGKIAFTLHVENTGDSTTPQVAITITSDNGTAVTSDDGKFFDSSFDPTKVSCTGSGNHFNCTPVGGTLKPGNKFDLFVRFTAPGSGDSVSTSAKLTVAAKTVGGKPNPNATLLAESTALTNLVTNDAKTQTFLRETDAEGASTQG